MQGSDRIEQYNSQEFWIDLKPVTTEEYLPVARQLVRDGRLQPFLSLLLTEENQSRAVESTNLKLDRFARRIRENIHGWNVSIRQGKHVDVLKHARYGRPFAADAGDI